MKYYNTNTAIATFVSTIEVKKVLHNAFTSALYNTFSIYYYQKT